MPVKYVSAVAISAARDIRSASGIGVRNAARGSPSASTRFAAASLRSRICSISVMSPSSTSSRKAISEGVPRLGSRWSSTTVVMSATWPASGSAT